MVKSNLRLFVCLLIDTVENTEMRPRPDGAEASLPQTPKKKDSFVTRL